MYNGESKVTVCMCTGKELKMLDIVLSVSHNLHLYGQLAPY